MPSRFLIVDDLDINRQMVRKLVQRHFPDAEVQEADSGRAALAAVQDQPPDIVVLDVKMPDMDGFEVCRRIKADPRIRSVLVMMVSGFMVNAESRISGLQSGADSYLCKPFENDELIAQLMALQRIHQAGQALVEKQTRLEIELTTRKRMEAQLETAKNAAESAVRAKSDFLAHMSHEIRTPMNAVIGMTEILLETDLSPEQQEYVRTIHTAGETLLTVINDILDHSKIESGKLALEQRPFRLDSLVEDAVGMVRSQAERKGLRLEVHFAPDTPCSVIGDTIRLRQILVNLLSNAVKFTEQGLVSVHVSACRLDHGFCEVHLVVRDTGIGIPSDKLERLFQAFSQVDDSTTRRFGGTGLGLAISQRLAKLMGGSIQVKSTEGRGSVFHTRLRLRYERLPCPEPEGSSDPDVSLDGRRVLVLDDNPVNRNLLVRQITAWGMTPVETASAECALRQLSEKSLPDLVLVDLIMPEVNGIEFARRVRAMTGLRDLPLVLLSSADLSLVEQTITHAENQSGLFFSARLQKPVDNQVLFDVVKSLVPRETPSPPAPSPDFGRDAIRILVAEDNPVNRKVAEYLLRRLGCQFDFAEDGRAAVAAARETAYDLILMDVQMPHLDGIEAMRAIRSEHTQGPMPIFAALTAHAMQGDREKYLDAGMDDYISKPIRTKDLVRVLDRCATRNQETGTPPHE